MKKRKTKVAVLEPIQPLIHEVRGHKVILDTDLARLYCVPTYRLNEAVKRNRERFPDDFCFQLTPHEAASLTSQFAMSKPGRGGRRSPPRVFTEHGTIMAANVLHSQRAFQVSIHVIRTFVSMRREVGRYEELARKLAELDHTQKSHGADIQMIIAAFRQLEETTSWAYPEGRRLIGFKTNDEKETKRANRV